MVLSSFHPAVATWFREQIGRPSPPQVAGWPAIAAGRHTLIAAPTGTGKTLAAFLWALDRLLQQGDDLPDATSILYVSPLRALSNDVQKNLAGPLAELRERDPSLPDVRVLVRTGDTTASERAKMIRKPPHVLVTTPESLYILLTSNGGRNLLRTVRTVIVDEIHALARDKRGSHLALSLERLEDLVADSARVQAGGRYGEAGPADEAPGGLPTLQRIGLSATQKPLEDVARLLVGTGRDCVQIDTGHLREMDVDVVVPDTPLAAVCSHEQWGEIYAKMAALIAEHRTTLIFVSTRKLAERLSARLTDQLGQDKVGCHHGSLSKDSRLQAEQRLKAGTLSALVATASLELGIDIGDVDLVMQVGAARSIATLLQRVGRAGHGMDRVPRGRLFPLTLDEAVEALTLLDALRSGLLDRTPQPPPALDILAQQAVAACVSREWGTDELFDCLRRAWPYRELPREDFEAALDLHTSGRSAMLHRDRVGGRLLATRRARIPAMTSGGAIPDNADYRVVLEPDGTFVGTLNEDFAVEANHGDIFQLGNTSWRILKVEAGIVRVADAAGQPPTLPFWLGEAPSRTAELSERIGSLREEAIEAMDVALADGCDDASAVRAMAAFLESRSGSSPDVTEQVAGFLARGRAALGAVPTQTRVVLERFFDDTGGMQLVLHSPFGGRINRAWGLALRKTFCRGFGFELQAAANEEAILISLGPHHSFPLEDVFKFLNSKSAKHTLTQALLAAPMFQTRWRWNVVRSLILPRTRGGKRVPPALQRMRADDLLVTAFPEVMACGETLPAGDLPVPMDHPVVRQTVEDCLNEAMDVDGFLALLTGLESGDIQRHAVDVPEPSPFSHGILSAMPYAFLDDAPLEERRTQAVRFQRVLDPRTAEELATLDPAAIARVREEAWPSIREAEELHEALLWCGYLSDREIDDNGWRAWLDRLATTGRVERDADGRWFAVEAPRSPKEILRGRLEILGPLLDDDREKQAFETELLELEAEGSVLRAKFEGRSGWCNRRLLQRMHRYTLDRLRREIEAVTATDMLRFLLSWQHVDEGRRLGGPAGVYEVVRQLAGFEAPAAAWESDILPARVTGYRKAWLDDLTLSGQVAWGRLWGAGTGSIRSTPITLLPREDLDEWLGLAIPGDVWSLKGDARAVHDVLKARGACFATELLRTASLLPAQVDQGLSELVGLGLASCDAFAGLRLLLGPTRSHRRRRTTSPTPTGRWSLMPRGEPEPPSAEFVARQLLRRWGIVFRKVLEKERVPVPWRDLLRVYRTLEARGEIRGGRFVAGFHGEQYALTDAVTLVRKVRRRERAEPREVLAADPLNLVGVLTPDERVASNAKARVRVG